MECKQTFTNNFGSPKMFKLKVELQHLANLYENLDYFMSKNRQIENVNKLSRINL